MASRTALPVVANQAASALVYVLAVARAADASLAVVDGVGEVHRWVTRLIVVVTPRIQDELGVRVDIGHAHDVRVRVEQVANVSGLRLAERSRALEDIAAGRSTRADPTRPEQVVVAVEVDPLARLPDIWIAVLAPHRIAGRVLDEDAPVRVDQRADDHVHRVHDQRHEFGRVRHRTEAQPGTRRMRLQEAGREGDQQIGVDEFARVYSADQEHASPRRRRAIRDLDRVDGTVLGGFLGQGDQVAQR